MTGHVLVLNAGSSSLKYSLVDAETGRRAGGGLVERIGESADAPGLLRHDGPAGRHEWTSVVPDHEAALRAALEAFERHGPSLAFVVPVAVGHRVVHGGAEFSAPALVDDALVAAVTALVPLAPLHNPANLTGIAGARRALPDLPHVAVFDTAFHQTLPPHAYTYAVPRSWATDHHVRRYGFHGTSVSFVSRRAVELLGLDPSTARLIVLHLGNGASATAVEGGRSVETSMGMTPLEGLVMGTRSGDIDPALPAYLARRLKWSAEEVDTQLNRASGLRGLAGHNDMREVLRLADAGDESARLALDVYSHRIRKYVGAYYAVLGQVDAIVFTGGVGENNPAIRSAALSGLQRLGVDLSRERNSDASDAARVVSTDASDVAVVVVPTDEEWEIARQVVAVVGPPAVAP